MHRTNRPSIPILAYLTLAASILAQDPSPRETFQAAVTAYQKAPTRETSLKVIELYKQLDPAPAVPEEAREPFVMGATVLRKAGNPAGASEAAALFTQSISIAPWFAEAYYNRALAREAGGQFGPAMDDLKLYLEFKLGEAERREVLDKVYSLKADARLAAARKLDEERVAAAKKAEEDKVAFANAQAKRFEGEWFRDAVSGGGDKARMILSIKHGAGDVWRVELTSRMLHPASAEGVSVWTKDSNVRDVHLVGSELRFKRDHGERHPNHFQVTANFEMSAAVTADGKVLRLTHTPLPFTASQAAYWAEWSKYIPKRTVDEYKRL